MTPPHREFFRYFLSMLHGAFFARYASGEEREAGLADRSQQAAMVTPEACSAAADASHSAVMGETVEGTECEAAIATYKAAESGIGHSVNVVIIFTRCGAPGRIRTSS
ncbi:hypothetical protein QEZ48_07560 [Aquamicrobium lusatiense]|uniref:hypothetical protein n=1 Tax=Aquamicrobium lusatiense TaxID=89772 RepID=UPI002454C5D5|nr:hypothetical protein [Aquamicrobium lusatiense]MDH4990686.1 hypothetical protein [Aquamicrobium lusatiense]